MRAKRDLAMLSILLLLAGCGSSHVVRRAAGDSGPVQVSQPKYGATTTVQRGQNLYRIATDNGITLRDLAAWNGIPAPYTIHPGQKLHLYPGAKVAAQPARPTASPRAPASRPPAAASAPVAAPPASPFAWRWPVEGSLQSTYVAGEPTQQIPAQDPRDPARG